VSEFVQVQTATDQRAIAASIGRGLVEARLAACAQVVGPMNSIYRWRERLTDADEWLLLLKVRAADYPAVEAELRRLHPYEEPEIIATPIVAGSASYLAWIAAETTRE
jgi:periplasmic divalent cation tolerance protein